MSDQDVIDRAHKAEKLLNDPLLTDAFNSVRTAIFHQIEQAPIRDKEGLHELQLMLKLLKDVRGNLEEAIRDGKVTAFRAKQRNQDSLVTKVRGYFNARS